MVTAFPLRFPAQLRQHLRSLRRKHGLTQTKLGGLIGVSQARIAEIEANPGLVNFDQLMKLLSVLNVSLTLQEATVYPASDVAATSSSRLKPADAKTPQPKATPEPPRLATRTRIKQQTLKPATKRALGTRPKKGSW